VSGGGCWNTTARGPTSVDDPGKSQMGRSFPTQGAPLKRSGEEKGGKIHSVQPSGITTAGREEGGEKGLLCSLGRRSHAGGKESRVSARVPRGGQNFGIKNQNSLRGKGEGESIFSEEGDGRRV